MKNVNFHSTFNTGLTFGEAVVAGRCTGSTDGGGVTGAAGSLGFSSCIYNNRKKNNG